jgi:hypothetical protein
MPSPRHIFVQRIELSTVTVDGNCRTAIIQRPRGRARKNNIELLAGAV